MLNTLGMAAIAVFFLSVSWFFIRIATASGKKKEFLASSLGCAGSGICVCFFSMVALLPIDKFGCTHEPAWTDTLVSVGCVALALGHCIQAWRTRFFLAAIVGVAFIYFGPMSVVQAVLPSAMKYVPEWIGLLIFAPTAQIWKNAETALRGGFFSMPISANFRQ